MATGGTAAVLEKAGLKVQRIFKLAEGRPNAVDLLKNREIQLVINTPAGPDAARRRGENSHHGGLHGHADHDNDQRRQGGRAGHRRAQKERLRREDAAGVSLRQNAGFARRIANVMPQTAKKKRFAFAGCLVLLVLFGWVDYITGYEMGFFVFYSLPVGLAAWYLGQWPAVGMALAASLTWWLADHLAGQRYSSIFYSYWNTAIHFSSFLINAVTFAKIKSSLDQRHRLADDLARTREQLRQVATLLPICPTCRKPLNPESLRQKTEAYLDSSPAAEIAETRCETCRAADSQANQSPAR